MNVTTPVPLPKTTLPAFPYPVVEPAAVEPLPDPGPGPGENNRSPRDKALHVLTVPVFMVCFFSVIKVGLFGTF